jgi:hypothetical protein
MKDGVIYLSYYYNNTNVIVKDTLDNFLKEIIASLKNKGVKCNEEKIYDIVKNKSVEDINLDVLMKYLNIEEGSYFFENKGVKVSLNDRFLPNELIYVNNKIKSSIRFDYEDVSIRIPLGYNIFTINIENLKETLDINYVSDLIKSK